MIEEQKPVAVVGAGLMGVGIATRFALAGTPVLLHDVSITRLKDARIGAEEILHELIEAGRIPDDAAAAALNRLMPCETLRPMRRAGLVIEAVIEQVEVKHRLYRELESVVEPGTTIASNTSGLLPDLLCDRMGEPGRFLVAHFWNPPHLIPLVELVPSSHTASHVVVQLAARLKAAGMEPVVLKKAMPGFIGNRIQFAVLREALHLVKCGVADVETVDAVVKACLGKRYQAFGPFESADLGGLETFLRIGRYLLPQLSKDEECLDLIDELVRHGRTGAGSGFGFYCWSAERLRAARDQRLRGIRTAPQATLASASPS